MEFETNPNNKKKKIIIIAAAVFLLAVIVFIFFYYRSEQFKATTMRLLRMEGEVTLEDNGKPKSIKDNMRLVSGNALATAIKSLASIGLDDTKIITLDEESRAIFNKAGKKLDLELTSGSLFFEVNKPLTDEESFEIRTSTMVVGIRGTSGYVTVDQDGRWNIVVTDGHVHVTGINPNTGETIETDVKAGQRCTVYLYNRDEKSVLFTLEDVAEEEIPDFVLKVLRDEPELLDKVVADTNWSKPVILGIAPDEEETQVEEPDIQAEEVEPTDSSDNDVTGIEETPVEATVTETVKSTTTTSEAESRVRPFIAIEADGKMLLTDGTLFDPDYYAKMHPELAGLDKYALLEHYLAIGKKAGLSANEQEELAKIAAAQQTSSDSSESDDEEESSQDSIVVNTNPYSVNGNDILYNGQKVAEINTSGLGDAILVSSTGKTLSFPMNVNGNTYSLRDVEYTSVQDQTTFSSNGNYNITYDAANDSYTGSYSSNAGLADLLQSNAVDMPGGSTTSVSTIDGPNNSSMQLGRGSNPIVFTDSSGNTHDVYSVSTSQGANGKTIVEFSSTSGSFTPDRRINEDGSVTNI